MHTRNKTIKGTIVISETEMSGGWYFWCTHSAVGSNELKLDVYEKRGFAYKVPTNIETA